jgi:hypothetical protein
MMGDKIIESLPSLVSFHNARSGVRFEQPEHSGATAAILAIRSGTLFAFPVARDGVWRVSMRKLDFE